MLYKIDQLKGVEIDDFVYDNSHLFMKEALFKGVVL